MGMWDNVKAAKITKSGNYYLPGNFKVRLLAVKTIVSTQKMGKPFFVVETVCTESDNPDIKVGNEYSQVIDMQNIMAGVNIKIFLAAATELDAFMESTALNDAIEERWSAMLERDMEFNTICDFVTSVDNPLEGVELGLQCVNVRTQPTPLKPTGGNFTKHQWFTLAEKED